MAFAVALSLPPGRAQGEVWINEIHYDNSGADSGEFVEVAGSAGTALAGYSLVFYNGAGGAAYKTENLSGLVPDEGAGFGARAFFIAGIQNGSPDGVALFEGATLLEFLSYEGTFSADGVTAVDIGVSEGASTPAGQSLQRVGQGAAAADFTWTGPVASSPGSINTGQTVSGGVPSVSLVVAPTVITEGEAAMVTVSMNPPPGFPLTLALSAAPAGQVALPPTVEVGAGGMASFVVSGLADSVGDGDAVVRLTASDPGGAYAAGEAEFTVIDIDPPPGRGAALRIATYNVQNGLGQPGDPAYAAALSVLRRVRADIVAFTETDPDDDFAALRGLLAELGIPGDEAHLATVGGEFAAAAYDGGDFGSGQAIAIASRYPVSEVVQIGRGEPGRTEMTRYPVYARIDLPGAADGHFVAVHFKAGATRADIFRRAVEAHRVREFLDARGIHGDTDLLFIVGDVNEDFEDALPSTVFTGVTPATHVFPDGSTFPASYLLGADLAAPGGISLPYSSFPAPAFSPAGAGIIDARQADGARRTYNVAGDARLDYLIAPGAVFGFGAPQAEVYNSLLEGGYAGLPKPGPKPPALASFEGSDHHLLFADVAIAPASKVLLSVSPASLEEAAPAVLEGLVSISPPAAGDVEVSLHDHGGRFTLPRSVRVPAGGAAGFPVALRRSAPAAADGQQGISAFAPGMLAGHAWVAVRGARPSSQLLFSEYVEPPSGGVPKAVELVNAGGEEIDFEQTPLRLIYAPNGASPGGAEVLLAAGHLPPGAVLVIGGGEAGDHLVGEGLLDDPGAPFASYGDGAAFLDGGGRAVFVKRPLFFNGDDALAVSLDYVLSDTFGRVGEDPGSAWEGGGVSTAQQHLRLRPDVGTGSAGWSDPSPRWESVGAGTDLAGFGIAPALDAPYLTWARGFGLTGAAAGTGEDLDRDGWPNLLEYAFGGNPLTADGGELSPRIVALAGGGPALSHRRPEAAGNLAFEVEVSTDGSAWQGIVATPAAPPTALGAGYELVSVGLGDDLGQAMFRVRVSLP